MQISAKYIYKCGFYGRKTPKTSQNQLYLYLRFLLNLSHSNWYSFLNIWYIFKYFNLKFLKLASELNLAAILFTGFLNFEFGAILAQFSGASKPDQ